VWSVLSVVSNLDATSLKGEVASFFLCRAKHTTAETKVEDFTMLSRGRRQGVEMGV